MEVVTVVALIAALAFWRRHPALFVAAALALFSFATYWIDSNPGAAYVLQGAVIGFIGAFCLFEAITYYFRR